MTNLHAILEEFEEGRRFDGDTGTDYFEKAIKQIQELLEHQAKELIFANGIRRKAVPLEAIKHLTESEG